MADAKFLIKITQRGAKGATSAVKKLSGSLGSLAKVSGIAAGVMGGVGLVAIKKATDAYKEQELADFENERSQRERSLKMKFEERKRFID